MLASTPTPCTQLCRPCSIPLARRIFTSVPLQKIARPKSDVRTAALPIVPLATVAYAFGAFKLWSGFGRTTFESEKKAQLTALWPFLYVASESFRANFKRALSD